ncbi:HAMP domain-containing sensor histidine kinase [Paenibacillus cymbidii]|uniref:HAMP domain-containing sensor histidine kinase n=1 Tax=Paenibacillus cymbidii TaxID=1639034 RepID=UPI0010800EEE|nr:HAMP domain-containing sensor histidine kinase [Paenibacillus cymbidii]
MLHRNISLRKKIVFLFAIVTILLTAIIVAFDSYSLRQTVEETYVSQLKGITAAINGRYEESHSIEDVQQIFDYIQYKDDNVIALTLIGNDGKVLASTNRPMIGTSPPLDNMSETMEQRENMVFHIKGDRDGIPKVRLLAPMFEDGTTIGVVEIFLNSSHEETVINERVRLIVVFASCICLLLLGMLSFIIQKMLIAPLMTLRKSAIAVQQGERHVQIPLNASGEINELSAAFNDMVVNLENRYQELQHAMETIKNAQKQLVQSEKMVALGSLVAGVSHEINTPVGIGVTAVSFLEQKTNEFAALFQQNKVKKSDMEQYLQTTGDTIVMIRTNLQRASDLVRSFKQVSVDQSSEAKRTFRIQSYLEDELLVSLRPRLKKTRHRVIVTCDPNLEITSYPGAISQIVTNLLMNSIIHAYGPQDEGTIRIAVDRTGDKLTLLYVDDGKGMEPQVVDKVFDPFFTTNRGGGGTGLGMNIVYNLVTQTLGGTIRCESEPGRGAAFTIEFSVAHAQPYSKLARSS